MTKKINKNNEPITNQIEEEDDFPFLDDDYLDLDFTEEDFVLDDDEMSDFDSDDDDEDDTDLDTDDDDEDDTDFNANDDDEDDTDFDSDDDDEDDTDFDSDDDDEDDTDFDSDDDDEDNTDFDSDDDDEDDTDFDSDNDDEDDTNVTDLFSDADDSNDDLFAMVFEKRSAQLPTDVWLKGIVSDITVEKVTESQFGKPWLKVKVHFEITNPTTGNKVAIVETGAKPKQASGRMYTHLVAINNGTEPTHLKKLIKKKVKVQIEHHTDVDGNTWDNVTRIKAL